MKIALGSDHAGYLLKEEIAEFLCREGYDFQDFGTFSGEPIDYPDIAREVSEEVAAGRFDYGILICGSGVGVSITANKTAGVRAALASDEYTAKVSRAHNDANVLALGGRVVGASLAMEIVKTFLETPFSGETRHAKRIQKIEGSNGGGC